MNIALIGCGYLGMELAKKLVKEGHKVTATTRSPSRLKELSQVATKSVVVKGNDEAEFVPLITSNEVIIVLTAIDSPEHYQSAYLHTAEILKKLALEMDLPRDLIYTSSTLVYGNQQGRWVDENGKLCTESKQSKILLDAENCYLSLSKIGWNVCVLRLSEVYGPGKEIWKKIEALKGRFVGSAGERFTNMVHVDDCKEAVLYALRHNLEGIYNLTDDEHPTWKELYERIAEKMNYPKVEWDSKATVRKLPNKRVSNHKIKQAGFHLKHFSRKI